MNNVDRLAALLIGSVLVPTGGCGFRDGSTGAVSTAGAVFGTLTDGCGTFPDAGPVDDASADVSVASDTGVAASALLVSVGKVSSSGISLSWTAPAGASSTRVYFSPEPPAVSAGQLPAARLSATLPGTTTQHTIARLAPGVDVFIRVEVDAQGRTHSQNLHARTTGGPRATLDTPVREVHGYAPNILNVVLTGGSGTTWQQGPWTVRRRDGSPVAVTRVHRHSIPVGAPSYTVGYGQPYSDTVIDVDHRIYLVLAAPIGSPEMLSVEGPSGVSFVLPFSDRYLETPVIQLNQVGYNPRATQRWAYVSGWMGSGGSLPLSNFPYNAEVLAAQGNVLEPHRVVTPGLAVAERSTFDTDAGGEVRQIDLARIPVAEGVPYRVRLPGVGVSWPTSISERAATKAYYTITRGLFMNRWGGNLQSAFTAWSRPADHPTVFTGEMTDFMAFYPESTPKVGPRALTGGYHDAGDFDQRPMHTLVPQLLMRAFEVNAGRFGDRQLTIPESGNGIPDLLDEALWGVAGWEQLQESDGGVRQGVESWRHPASFYFANTDQLSYWTYAREPNVTARAAALFAQASRLVAPFNATRAATLRQRAINAWRYATSRGAARPYILYAAGELYRLTSEATYRSAFESAWSGMGQYGAFSNMAIDQGYLGNYGSNSTSMPDYLQGYLGSAAVSSTIASTARSWLLNYANEAVGVSDNAHAHRNPRPSGRNMDWGHGTTMVRDLDTVIARLQLGGLAPDVQQRYFNALSLAADYLLGGNPNGLVYVTGLGSRRVEEPLHLDSLCFIKQGVGPMPGIPVYGPVASLQATSWSAATRAAFYPDFGQFPLGLRYADVRTLVTTNEFTVWENQAPDAELLAILVGAGAMPPSSWLPGGSEHRSPLP